jgi:hypothetical protein
MKALSFLKPLQVGSMQVRSQSVELPVPSMKPQDIVWAKNILSQYGRSTSVAFDDVVKAWRIIDLAGNEKDISERHRITTSVPLNKASGTMSSEVEAIVLGKELALIGFPGDAFVELGLAIKQNSPYPYTIVNEQSGNGSISYVPNRKGVLEGGYEGVSARFSPGGGELLTDAVIRILTGTYPYK